MMITAEEKTKAEQAIKNLDQVAATAQGTREAHVILQEGLELLRLIVAGATVETEQPQRDAHASAAPADLPEVYAPEVVPMQKYPKKNKH